MKVRIEELRKKKIDNYYFDYLKDIVSSIDRIFVICWQVQKDGQTQFSTEQEIYYDISLLKGFIRAFEKFIENVRESVLVIYP